MASGIKGAVAPSGGNPTLGTAALFTASTTTTVILAVCNTNAADATIRIAVCPAGTATSGNIPTENYLEYDFTLSANTSFERTGITLENNARIIVGSNNGGDSFVCYGLES